MASEHVSQRSLAAATAQTPTHEIDGQNQFVTAQGSRPFTTVANQELGRGMVTGSTQIAEATSSASFHQNATSANDEAHISSNLAGIENAVWDAVQTESRQDALSWMDQVWQGRGWVPPWPNPHGQQCMAENLTLTEILNLKHITQDALQSGSSLPSIWHSDSILHRIADRRSPLQWTEELSNEGVREWHRVCSRQYNTNSTTSQPVNLRGPVSAIRALAWQELQQDGPLSTPVMNYLAKMANNHISPTSRQMRDVVLDCFAFENDDDVLPSLPSTGQNVFLPVWHPGINHWVLLRYNSNPADVSKSLLGWTNPMPKPLEFESYDAMTLSQSWVRAVGASGLRLYQACDSNNLHRDENYQLIFNPLRDGIISNLPIPAILDCNAAMQYFLGLISTFSPQEHDQSPRSDSNLPVSKDSSAHASEGTIPQKRDHVRENESNHESQVSNMSNESRKRQRLLSLGALPGSQEPAVSSSSVPNCGDLNLVVELLSSVSRICQHQLPGQQLENVGDVQSKIRASEQAECTFEKELTEINEELQSAKQELSRLVEANPTAERRFRALRHWYEPATPPGQADGSLIMEDDPELQRFKENVKLMSQGLLLTPIQPLLDADKRIQEMEAKKSSLEERLKEAQETTKLCRKRLVFEADRRKIASLCQSIIDLTKVADEE